MSMLDRIRDSFKYLDKNGLKHLIEKIKLHDVHWTGTHAEYEAVKDTLPAYTILHFTDDYEDSVGVVDKIEDNNMNGVTSNAVAEALVPIGTHAGGYFYRGFNTTGQHNTNLTLGEGTWLVIMTLLTGQWLSGDMYMTAGGTKVGNRIRESSSFDKNAVLNAMVTVAAGATKVIGMYQENGAADVNGDANYWYVDAYRLK